MDILLTYKELGIDMIPKAEVLKKSKLYASELNRIMNTLMEENLVKIKQLRQDGKRCEFYILNL